jgi:chemotaxis protein MotB
VVEIRQEGLRIQLIDKEKESMFASGSSVVLPKTQKLMGMIAKLITPLTNQLVISGHTDARPYAKTRHYSNWELSADRANATRRILSDQGIAAGRFESVMGKESTEPYLKENPSDASNRRISVTLLRQFGVPSSELFNKLTDPNG